MNDVNLGYKLIALAAVFSSIYSCNSSVNSQNSLSTAAQLVEIRNSIGELSAQVALLHSQVAATDACTVEALLSDPNALDNPAVCAGKLPDDVGLTTTFCIAQERGVELGADLKLEMNFEMEGGGGWPNVLWGKGTAMAAGPVVLSTPPFILPTEMGGGASTSLGRGLEICADVPIEPTPEQTVQIADLIRGVNQKTGFQAKYHRRANRLLNYAARRTPVAEPNLALSGAFKGQVAVQRAPEEADDAFDIADEAVERFMANGFQPQARLTEILADPIFLDLASSLDLPEQLTSIIQDPQQVLSGFQPITAANACATLGIDASLRSRFPQLNSMCTRIENLPNDQVLQTVGANVTAVRSRVFSMWTSSQLRNFICSNVTLAVFAPGC